MHQEVLKVKNKSLQHNVIVYNLNVFAPCRVQNLNFVTKVFLIPVHKCWNDRLHAARTKRVTRTKFATIQTSDQILLFSKLSICIVWSSVAGLI